MSVFMLLVLGVSSYETGLRAVGGDRIGDGVRWERGRKEGCRSIDGGSSRYVLIGKAILSLLGYKFNILSKRSLG